jgi:eukaryotic-like serine/threonine-protein kinase
MALSEKKLGPYDIVGPLGAGGMGEVYRATDTRLKRQVAIKILPAGLAMDPDRLGRFQREAELLASLNHPNIASVYGLEDSNGVKALVMELIEGPTLADRIRQGPIPIDEALPIARQIAAALEAAHEQGIIHRDLKPANIKVRDDGTVKVLDFGLAKLTDPTGAGRSGGSGGPNSDAPTMTSPAATAMGMILGTAAYMSPEQARGRVVDKRTDVWAFGAVLYEMLTGTRAFEGEDIAETIASVMKTTPNWSALPADVPPQIITLVQRCLEKDRNARIGDIAVARFLLSDHATFSIAPTVATASTTSVASAAGMFGAATTSGVSPATATASAGPAAAAPDAVSGVRVRDRSARGRRVPRWLWVVGGLLMAVWFLRGGDDKADRAAVDRRASRAIAHLQLGVSPADMLVTSTASLRPSRTAMAISPDGRTVVFSAIKGPGLNQQPVLYLRPLDRVEATPVPNTDGAIAPVFSPDGRWIAFWTGKILRKVPVAGGPPATIASTAAIPAWGTTWGDGDTIYFADRTGIFKVPAAGGTPTQVTKRDADKAERHTLPHLLPGGKVLLYTSVFNDDWDTANVIALDLQKNEKHVLIEQAADARFVDTGHLVFMKSGTLMGVAFNVASVQMIGSPIALIDNVMQAINMPNGGDETGAGQFTISDTGTLLYLTGGISPNLLRSLVWADRSGTATPLPPGVAGPYLHPRVSPDGRRIAIEVKRGPSRNGTDLWMYDVSRAAATRVTFNGSNAPVWSPDGKRLVHQIENLYIINADGSQPEQLTTSNNGQPASWSGPANAIAYLQYNTTADGRRTSRLWIVPMAGDRKPKIFIDSEFRVQHAEFSPDGRWMAYTSTESGNDNVVYVQPYPGPGEKIRISPGNGNEPVWNPNGKELFYRTGTAEGEEFYTVPIHSLSPFKADAPRLLFKAKAGEYDSTAPVRGWDVSADGQRFLLLRAGESGDKPVSTINIVQHWTEELKRAVQPR